MFYCHLWSQPHTLVTNLAAQEYKLMKPLERDKEKAKEFIVKETLILPDRFGSKLRVRSENHHRSLKVFGKNKSGMTKVRVKPYGEDGEQKAWKALKGSYGAVSVSHQPCVHSLHGLRPSQKSTLGPLSSFSAQSLHFPGILSAELGWFLEFSEFAHTRGTCLTWDGCRSLFGLLHLQSALDWSEGPLEITLLFPFPISLSRDA